MSGHSKWATIKRQKGLNDAKRGQAFTKISNAITIAVKQSGGNADPESNVKLRFAIDKAKASNMPRDSIDRAIQKGAGNLGGAELDEVLYEGFAPGGVGILIEAVTDKKQRTVAEVKNTIEKNGGTMAGQGAVSYLFKRTGEIIANKNNHNSDDVLTIALDNDIVDVEEEDNLAFFYTDPQNLTQAKNGIEGGGLKIEEVGLSYKPLTTMQVAPEIEEKVLGLVEKLEDMDDVQKVYTNL